MVRNPRMTWISNHAKPIGSPRCSKSAAWAGKEHGRFLTIRGPGPRRPSWASRHGSVPLPAHSRATPARIPPHPPHTRPSRHGHSLPGPWREGRVSLPGRQLESATELSAEPNRPTNERSPHLLKARAAEKNRRRPTLPGGCPPSTIGAERLNCSVRNGKRCLPFAMHHRRFARRSVELENCTRQVWVRIKISVKPSNH